MALILKPLPSRAGFFQTAAGGAAAGNPMYQLLGRTTLDGDADTVDVTSLAAKDNLMIIFNTVASGTCSNKFTLNGVTASTYSRIDQGNGGGAGSNPSEANWGLNYTSDDNYRFGYFFLNNDSDTEKTGFANTVQSVGSGSSDVPNRMQGFLGWEKDDQQITQVTMTNDKTGSYASGTEVVVLGSNADDTDDNVWEELASVEITSDGDAIDTGTFTAKNYLWIQLFNVDNGTGDMNMTFNGLTSGYAERYSDDFGSDSTNGDMGGISSNYGALQGNTLANYMVINADGKQKLVNYTYSIQGGSAATVPQSLEAVSNCTTTDQVTRVQVTVGGGNFGSGSWLKVWGFD